MSASIGASNAMEFGEFGEGQEGLSMVLNNHSLHRKFFLHYRLVRETLTVTAATAAALLCSYLILGAKF